MSAVMEEDIKRWTARRKATLVLEIIQGKTTVAEASRSFDLTPSEIEEWVDEGKRGAMAGRGTTTASSAGTSCVMSLRLAAITMIVSGTPRASTSNIRLLPFFPPVSGHWLLCQR